MKSHNIVSFSCIQIFELCMRHQYLICRFARDPPPFRVAFDSMVFHSLNLCPVSVHFAYNVQCSLIFVLIDEPPVTIVRILLSYLRKKGPTTEYRPTPHFGLNFLLRSKVYSNMRPYVAALEHACASTIKWAWLRSLAVHDRSLRLKRGI